MDDLQKIKTIALVIGAILLSFYIFNFLNPIFVGSVDMLLAGQLISFFIYISIRIASAILCDYIAKKLNRSDLGWAVFGFILPPVSLIIISQLGEKKKNKDD